MLARGGVLLLPSICEGWLACWRLARGGEAGTVEATSRQAGGGRRPWPVTAARYNSSLLRPSTTNARVEQRRCRCCRCTCP